MDTSSSSSTNLRLSKYSGSSDTNENKYFKVERTVGMGKNHDIYCATCNKKLSWFELCFTYNVCNALAHSGYPSCINNFCINNAWLSQYNNREIRNIIVGKLMNIDDSFPFRTQLASDHFLYFDKYDMDLKVNIYRTSKKKCISVSTLLTESNNFYNYIKNKKFIVESYVDDTLWNYNDDTKESKKGIDCAIEMINTLAQ